MTFLKSEFRGLHKNDKSFYPKCFGGREIAKNKVAKVLVDTLYGLIKNLSRIKLKVCILEKLPHPPPIYIK